MKKLLSVVVLSSVIAMSASGALLANVEAREYDNPQVICLAKNIYFESRGDNFAGQIAVADVTMNRAANRNYPDTVCAVVQQGKQDRKGNMLKNQCQFSWYCDGKPDTIPNKETNDQWLQALDLASNMYYNKKWRGLTDGATHYHASYVAPAWKSSLKLVGRIGEHIFYRQD